MMNTETAGTVLMELDVCHSLFHSLARQWEDSPQVMTFTRCRCSRRRGAAKLTASRMLPTAGDWRRNDREDQEAAPLLSGFLVLVISLPVLSSPRPAPRHEQTRRHVAGPLYPGSNR